MDSLVETVVTISAPNLGGHFLHEYLVLLLRNILELRTSN
jgi:hypothetical protein